MKTRTLFAEGHLIDSGILSKILNGILQDGGDYRVISFDVGKTPEAVSSIELELNCRDEGRLQAIADKLTQLGVFEREVQEAVLRPAMRDRHAPDDFYSTTNHPTEVYYRGAWRKVMKQRMDAVLVWREQYHTFACTKLRDLVHGDMVLCGGDSLRVFPAASSPRRGDFSFMANEVSSERSDRAAVDRVASELADIRRRGGKVAAVCGPAVIHTGAGDALAWLIREGYIKRLLGGNALAVHDIESQLYGTSLGVDLNTGEVIEHGHTHHMRAINYINGYGSIAEAVVQGGLTAGVMYEVIKAGIPYCLAGSIRDDGPLPETVTDMIEAQDQYAKIIEDAELIVMFSSMLHAIGTGNMTPSWVKMVCVDINPAVVTKLSDRGSAHTVGIVSDTGLFLHELVRRLTKLEE